jgi:hypothetical protein
VNLLERMRQLMLAGEPADIRKMEPQMRDLVLAFRQVKRKIAEAEWATQDWLARVNRESLAGLGP